jgi:hypothetical protein
MFQGCIDPFSSTSCMRVGSGGSTGGGTMGGVTRVGGFSADFGRYGLVESLSTEKGVYLFQARRRRRYIHAIGAIIAAKPTMAPNNPATAMAADACGREDEDDAVGVDLPRNNDVLLDAEDVLLLDADVPENVIDTVMGSPMVDVEVVKLGAEEVVGGETVVEGVIKESTTVEITVSVGETTVVAGKTTSAEAKATALEPSVVTTCGWFKQVFERPDSMRKDGESAVAPVLSRMKTETNVPAAILMFQINEVPGCSPRSSRGGGSCSPPGRMLKLYGEVPPSQVNRVGSH